MNWNQIRFNKTLDALFLIGLAATIGSIIMTSILWIENLDWRIVSAVEE